jgi:hypothetical protein
MSNTPYRIIFFPGNEENPYATWEFDDAEFETAEAAFDAALKEHPYEASRIVKLCYPIEG